MRSLQGGINRSHEVFWGFLIKICGESYTSARVLLNLLKRLALYL